MWSHRGSKCCDAFATEYELIAAPGGAADLVTYWGRVGDDVKHADINCCKGAHSEGMSGRSPWAYCFLFGEKPLLNLEERTIHFQFTKCVKNPSDLNGTYKVLFGLILASSSAGGTHSLIHYDCKLFLFVFSLTASPLCGLFTLLSGICHENCTYRRHSMNRGRNDVYRSHAMNGTSRGIWDVTNRVERFCCELFQDGVRGNLQFLWFSFPVIYYCFLDEWSVTHFILSSTTQIQIIIIEISLFSKKIFSCLHEKNKLLKWGNR